MKAQTPAALLLVPCLMLGAAPTYVIDTIAGSGQVGDGGLAVAASLSDAEGVAVDRAGNVYVADANDHRVRKVNTAGVISTVAGTGQPGFSGDGGPAQQAQLNSPYSVAVDPAGNLYIADLGNNRVRKVTPSGQISTYVGGGAEAGFIGLAAPRNVAVDTAGNLYISEFDGNRVRKVNPDGEISTVAGTGTAGYNGDGAAPDSTQLNHPAGLTVDRAGALYIADSSNHRVRLVFNGRVVTILGTGVAGDGTTQQVNTPTGVTTDFNGNVFVADSGNQRVRRISALGVVTTWITGLGGAREEVRDVAADAAGSLYVAGRERVIKMLSESTRSLLAGDGAWASRGDGGPATAARLGLPLGLALDAAGNLFIADETGRRVRKVPPSGTIATVVGAQAYAPRSLAVDGSGNLYIASADQHTVRRIAPSGLETVLAGVGYAERPVDGPANRSPLWSPSGVAVDWAGSVYIADTGNHRIRKVSSGGAISTLAGTGVRGGTGDGGSAVLAQLDTPRGVAVDSALNVYIADTANHRIRKVTPSGSISTIAGDGTTVELQAPRGVAVDASGNVFIADTGNNRVRMLSTDGAIRTIAGTGASGFGGDGGAALAAQLSLPSALLVDALGNVWVADTGNARVRKLTPGVPPATVELPPPAPQVRVVNAASLVAGPVTRGEAISILGSDLGPPEGVASAQGDLALGGVEALFDGQPATVLYAQQAQVNAVVPGSVAGTTVIEARYKGVVKGQAVVAVGTAAPGLFTVSGGTGQALVLHEDGTLNSESNAAARGALVTFYVTGEGQGGAPMVLKVDGSVAEIRSIGPLPGTVGVTQIGARLPFGFVRQGVVPVTLQIGTAEAQPGVTMSLR